MTVVNMEDVYTKCIFTIVLFAKFVLSTDIDHLITLPGHLKPFGTGTSSKVIAETYEFPDPKTFFEQYVFGEQIKPVLMKGAAKQSQSFLKWTDDYFISLSKLSDAHVDVETIKKENRSQHIMGLTFTDFVQQYNNSEIYMVNPVPGALR